MENQIHCKHSKEIQFRIHPDHKLADVQCMWCREIIARGIKIDIDQTNVTFYINDILQKAMNMAPDEKVTWSVRIDHQYQHP